MFDVSAVTFFLVIGSCLLAVDSSSSSLPLMTLTSGTASVGDIKSGLRAKNIWKRGLQQEIPAKPRGVNFSDQCWVDTQKLANITDLSAALTEVQNQGVSFGWADPNICQYPTPGSFSCAVEYADELQRRVQQPCEANHLIYSRMSYQIFCTTTLNITDAENTDDEFNQQLQESEVFYDFRNVPGCVADVCQEDGALAFLEYLTQEMKENFEIDLPGTACLVQNFELLQMEDYLTPLEVCLLESNSLAESSEALTDTLEEATQALATFDYISFCGIQPNQYNGICNIDALPVILGAIDNGSGVGNLTSPVEAPVEAPIASPVDAPVQAPTIDSNATEIDDALSGNETAAEDEDFFRHRHLSDHLDVAQVCEAEGGLYIVSSFSLLCFANDGTNETETFVQFAVENFPSCITASSCEASMYERIAQDHSILLAERLVELQIDWDRCDVLDVVPEVEDFSPSASPTMSAMPTISAAPSASPTVATPSPTEMPVAVDLTDETCSTEDTAVTFQRQAVLNDLARFPIAQYCPASTECKVNMNLVPHNMNQRCGQVDDGVYKETDITLVCTSQHDDEATTPTTLTIIYENRVTCTVDRCVKNEEPEVILSELAWVLTRQELDYDPADCTVNFPVATVPPTFDGICMDDTRDLVTNTDVSQAIQRYRENYRSQWPSNFCTDVVDEFMECNMDFAGYDASDLASACEEADGQMLSANIELNCEPDFQEDAVAPQTTVKADNVRICVADTCSSKGQVNEVQEEFDTMASDFTTFQGFQSCTTTVRVLSEVKDESQEGSVDDLNNVKGDSKDDLQEVDDDDDNEGDSATTSRRAMAVISILSMGMGHTLILFFLL